MKAESEEDCMDWCEWLCEGCDTERCASYRPPVDEEGEKKCKVEQLKLFEI